MLDVIPFTEFCNFVSATTKSWNLTFKYRLYRIDMFLKIIAILLDAYLNV